MTFLRRLLKRLARVGGRDPHEAEMDDEMRFHLESEIADRVRSGMTREEARRTALRDFGGVARHKEEAREVRHLRWIDDLAQDLRYAVRSLRHAPGVAVASIATLALGTGAVATVYSLVNGILLRPLPYPQSDRLAVIWEHNIPRNLTQNPVSVSNFEAFRERSRSFAALAMMTAERLTLLADGPERVLGGAVSPSWFGVIATRPALGRAFTTQEAEQAASVIVLSHALWKSRFAADPAIIGLTVQFGDRSLTVVGVMAEGFGPPAFGYLGFSSSNEQRFWVPFVPNDANRRWGRAVLVLGRLRSGVSLEQANAEIRSIAANRALEVQYNRDWTADVVSLHSQVTGPVRAALLVLLVAAAGLFTTTMVNTAFITFARLRRRSSELGLRAALGAGRGRLLRQLFAEAVAIAMIGAPIGILLAIAGVKGLLVTRPVNLPRLGEVIVDWRVVGLVVFGSLAATVLAAVVSALRLRSKQLSEMLAHGTAGRVTAPVVGRTLVIAEVALALLLAVGAGLAMRSFLYLRATDLGFSPGAVLAFRVSLAEQRYSGDRPRIFFEQLATGIRTLPGVRAVGLVSVRPLGGNDVATNVWRQGNPPRPGEAPTVADVVTVSPEYFTTMGIPLIAGRLVEPKNVGANLNIRDGIISRTMATSLWPGEAAVGKIAIVNLNGSTELTVVGVVDDVRLYGPAVPARSTVYFAFEGETRSTMDVVLRTTSRPDALMPAIRALVATADRTVPVYSVMTLDTAIADSVAQERLTFALLVGFSAVALALAAAGVTGMLMIEVARRRRELGIRIALGAAPGQVRTAVVRSGLTLALLGSAIGATGALVLTRFMSSFLHGVAPNDLTTYVTVTLVLLGTALGASYLPARHATRVDPLEVLRAE